MLEQIDPDNIALYRWRDFDMTSDEDCVSIDDKTEDTKEENQ